MRRQSPPCPTFCSLPCLLAHHYDFAGLGSWKHMRVHMDGDQLQELVDTFDDLISKVKDHQ